VRKSGCAIDSVYIRKAFATHVRSSGLRRRDGATIWPRISDLRATFAVHRITAWLKDESNLNQMLPALATYLGQSGLGSIEGYLKLAPERFRKQLLSLSPQKSRRHWRDDPNLMRFLASSHYLNFAARLSRYSKSHNRQSLANLHLGILVRLTAAWGS
jgi:integrase/recombinase XerD